MCPFRPVTTLHYVIPGEDRGTFPHSSCGVHPVWSLTGTPASQTSQRRGGGHGLLLREQWSSFTSFNDASRFRMSQSQSGKDFSWMQVYSSYIGSFGKITPEYQTAEVVESQPFSCAWKSFKGLYLENASLKKKSSQISIKEKENNRPLLEKK